MRSIGNADRRACMPNCNGRALWAITDANGARTKMVVAVSLPSRRDEAGRFPFFSSVATGILL
jgi:hypothetical protein